MSRFDQLANTHDLRLPTWGPYTKKYTGISHLPDVPSGLRFDLSVFPGYYRRGVLVPNAKWESGFHPWEAAPDLSYYSYRYELEWKDRVYCDISFSALDSQRRLIRCEFHNRTALPQNLALHYMASMNFPPLRTYSDEILRPSRVILPEGAVWLGSLDYDDLGFATPRPQDNLGYDGLRRGEVRGNGFTGGSGVGLGFGGEAGDWVQYTFRLQAPIAKAVLLARYRALAGAGRFRLSGLTHGILDLPEGVDFALVEVPTGDLSAGEYHLHLDALGAAAVELDGFILISKDRVGQVQFEAISWQPVPQIEPGSQANSLVLKYADADSFYGLSWLTEPAGLAKGAPPSIPWEVRQLYTDELDRFLRYYVQEHVQKILYGNRQGHFTNVFIRPIEVPPGERRVLYGLACAGERPAVEKALEAFRNEPVQLETAYQRAQAKIAQLKATPAGESYRFSQERMAATVLTNVVYPIYTRRSFIRHYTPGKWWDCLYTWDSGFIGLGLLELDTERAIDCLNAYTTPPGDSQAAFLHHGSMVPTQFYLFLELWNRTQDQALLAYFYPRLRQYYRFFAGRLGSSTTRRMKSNLLKTWDYFYNSGGWDDYPPQVYVHRNGLESTVTPVISTAHGIRCAKVLILAARALGQAEDIPEYQADIDAWTQALNQHAWDAHAGYFSYVRHNAAGDPQDFLRHEGGQNYNMGLDGASPFFAGVCNGEQERLILERLKSAAHMWTPLGVCTVDKTAAYYRVDGYWNGAVWFPQQWFYWKALLDMGYTDFAAQIVQAALDTWKAEVDDSYHCCEHFIVQSGRGAGWHQFGGLSTPVLMWYGATYQPGRLTTGFDTWVSAVRFSENNQRLEADLEAHTSRDRFAVLATMQPGKEYTATWNNRPVQLHERYPGHLEISLDGSIDRGRLVVSATAATK
jgi:hypothetical protein